jgi:ABC-type transporter Mla subunit MlaD
VADDRSEPGRSRLSAAVGGVPVLGDLARQVEAQARWLQELVEQNARLVGQLPATLKSFNDSLERFNQTVGRLDRAVSRIETSTARLAAPMERLSSALDPKALRELPDLVDSLRKEALPALRAAADTQQQVAVVQSTLDRIVAIVADFPGAGILKRMAAPEGGTDRRG